MTPETSLLASTGQHGLPHHQAGCCALQGVGPVEVTRLLWGLAVVDQLPKPAAAGLYEKLALMPLTSFTAECLDQILQVLCFAVLCCAALHFKGHGVACHAVLQLTA